MIFAKIGSGQTHQGNSTTNPHAFRFVSFRFVSFRFVSFRFVSFRFVSFRFVSFRSHRSALG
eukprot:COSAG06_NODE_61819_length_266_cov_1.269461_1_plen_61_part_01